MPHAAHESPTKSRKQGRPARFIRGEPLTLREIVCVLRGLGQARFNSPRMPVRLCDKRHLNCFCEAQGHAELNEAETDPIEEIF